MRIIVSIFLRLIPINHKYICFKSFREVFFLCKFIKKNMKKKLLLTSVLIASTCAINLKAQITFTSADLQEAGKTYVTKTDTLTSVNLGSPSAIAQNWDFSMLLMHYMSGPSFDLTTNTIYDVDYPNSNLYTYGPAIMFGGFYGGAPVSSQGMDNGYMFWRKDVTGFWTEGFMADEGPYAGKKVYTVPQEMIIGTPATLGSIYSNDSQWDLTYDENVSDIDTLYQSFVSKTQTGDAWGSLTTPTGTYPDVLRIHENGIKIDSVKSFLAGNPILFLEFSRDTFNNYIYVENGTHYPLALVKADNNNVIRSVEYYFMQGFLGTEIINESKLLNVYPNPSEGLLIVEMSSISNSINTFVLTDSYGKIVKELSLDQLQNQIDCSTFKSGIYFYTITSGSEIETGQLIIR
jgi:hypothetical protein